jgi:hypothetical protein
MFVLCQAVGAVSLCPSEHFQPTTYFGNAFHDSRPVTEYEFSKPDEELSFQFIEYQSFEKGYQPVYSVSLLRSETGHYRVALVRAKYPETNGGKPIALATFRELPDMLAERTVAGTTLVLRNTHYPPVSCTQQWIDGYRVQALVPNVQGFGDLVGEVYIPPKTSEAGAVVELGRVLRSYIEGKVEVQGVESVVAELERHNSTIDSDATRQSFRR